MFLFRHIVCQCRIYIYIYENNNTLCRRWWLWLQLLHFRYGCCGVALLGTHQVYYLKRDPWEKYLFSTTLCAVFFFFSPLFFHFAIFHPLPMSFAFRFIFHIFRAQWMFCMHLCSDAAVHWKCVWDCVAMTMEIMQPNVTGLFVCLNLLLVLQCSRRRRHPCSHWFPSVMMINNNYAVVHIRLESWVAPRIQ